MNSFPIEKLPAAIERFAPGHQLGPWEPLHGGISAEMVRFETIGPNPGTYVARVPYPASSPEREFKILDLAHRLNLRAQRPVSLEPDFFIAEWMHGAPDLAPADPEAYVRQYAQLMAQIHQADLGQHDLYFLDVRDDEVPPPRNSMDEALREPEIRERLATLSPLKEPHVLRHGDLWPGNLIWEDGVLVGAIDWEECSLGNRLLDLAIARLDLLFILDWSLVDLFTETYEQLIPFDRSFLPRYDLLASLRPTGYLDHWVPAYPKLGREDITLETMTKAHGEFVEHALLKSA